jgi:hypothetical protein
MRAILTRSVTISGSAISGLSTVNAPRKPLPEWDQLLSAVSRLQTILPGTVLGGGTATALHVQHRLSRDADHMLSDLRTRYDDVLADLEAVAGWKTARVQRPVQILGSLDGIETSVRQIRRSRPLETMQVSHRGETITLPTKAEMLRIKAVLILQRNATRDYLDFVALADNIGAPAVVEALRDFDAIYPQPNDQSALQQLVIQLSTPLPFDLDAMDLSEYNNLVPVYHDWSRVADRCHVFAASIFDVQADGSGPAPEHERGPEPSI